MRITKLVLGRYGHLADVELTFDPDIGLHIVLGANEAGKSTALAAIGDALFGFPNRTQFGFLHRQQDLRLGIGLRGQDGQEGFFLRRKGRQDTLRDGDEAVLPEAAILRFLGGASREKFTELFGMDGAELRRGGAAILEGKGEIGQSIVQAHTGLHNVRAAVSRLNEAALELYGDKRGGRAFHVAAEAFRTAKQDVEQRSLRPADYDQAASERAAILVARAKNREESARLEGERARLDRIRRTTPARLALLRDRAARSALGDIPALPDDSERKRADAVQSHIVLSLEFTRAQRAQAQDEAALQAIRVDEALLGAGETIDALRADVNRIEGAVRDRETQRLAAAQARSRVEETGTRLGLSLDAETLVLRLPGDFLRAEAARAIKEFTELAARRRELAVVWEQAETAAEAARLHLAALAPPEPMEGLVAAVESAKGEGRIDADCAAAEEACATAQASLARGLAALPFWDGGAEALANAGVPLAAAFAALEGRLVTAEAVCADRKRELARLDELLGGVEAELAGVLAAGEPPTAEAVAQARRRRDRAWQRIRTRYIEGGENDDDSEDGAVPAEPGIAALPSELAGMMADADSLADRRTEEAERIATYEQLRANRARWQLTRATEQTALEKALAALTESQTAWENLWRPAGVAPGDPAQMREWLAKRQALLGVLDDALAKTRQLARLHARRDAVCQNLAAVLPDTLGLARDRVAPLLQAATLRRLDLDSAHQVFAEARRAAAESARGFAEQDRKRQALETAIAAWLDGWAPIARALGLPDGAGAEAGADSLGIWADIDRHARDMRLAAARVAEMTTDIEAFAGHVARACAACAPDLASYAPPAAMRALAGRLAQSRAAETQRTTLRQNVGTRAEHLDKLAKDMAKAQDDLAALRAIAGVADDEALQEAIKRARTAADLAKAMEERSHELHRLDDGLTLEELAREAEGEDADLLAGRIAAIDERMREMAAENEGFASRLRDLDTRIAAMERGHDAAEAAQRMRDAAAEAEDIAARYVRLRMSHALLRAGIERFRREQQAPLLEAAGTCFAALTERRYVALAVEETDDAKMVVALRPDGTSCPADRLSEGTRDQLYLALRLAAIRSHAARAEQLPFIADDLLASFDDRRARATLDMLAGFGGVTQTILFTHHGHIAAMADPGTSRLHRLAVG